MLYNKCQCLISANIFARQLKNWLGGANSECKKKKTSQVKKFQLEKGRAVDPRGANTAPGRPQWWLSALLHTPQKQLRFVILRDAELWAFSLHVVTGLHISRHPRDSPGQKICGKRTHLFTSWFFGKQKWLGGNGEQSGKTERNKWIILPSPKRCRVLRKRCHHYNYS